MITIPINYRTTGVATFFALLPLAVIAWVHHLLGVETGNITRDVAVLADIHPLTGALSSMGILMWWAAAAIWFFSSAIHHKLRSHEEFLFTLSFGLLSSYLALDDLFQIHEYLAPTYLGIREGAVYVALVLALISIIVRFRQRMMCADTIFLVLSLGLLACSMLIDIAAESDSFHWSMSGDYTYLLEDGAKWLGIVCWCGFSILRCMAEILARQNISTIGKR